MNIALVHEELAKAGYDVLGVCEDGRVDFATPKTENEKLAIRKIMLEFKELTREQLAARILVNRDKLIDQLLLERFMPPEK